MTEPENQKKAELEVNESLSENQRHVSNYWRMAFLILLGVVVGITVFLGVRIFSSQPEYKNMPEITAIEGEPVLTINSNKEKVNQLISFFLSDFQKEGDIEYKFYLENEAMLNGQFEVLGFPVNFYLYFEPYVMENGNVQLKAKSLSIGTLSLPIKDVMNMVKRNYNLPKWVEIDTKDLTVMLRLDKFRMQNGMYIKADKINLVDDDIRFSLYLPASEKATKESSDK